MSFLAGFAVGVAVTYYRDWIWTTVSSLWTPKP